MPKDEVSNKKRTEVKTKKDLKKEWETEGKGLGYDTPEEYFNDFYGPIEMKKGGMPIVIKLNPEKEIGYKITDVGSGKVIKEGSTKVKDLDKKRMGGMSKVKKYNSGKMVKNLHVSGAAMTEGERKRLKKTLESAENASSSSSNKNLHVSGAAMSEREFEQLLPPGGDPGEGYRGSPDMYPDYEEDRKEAEKFKNKNRNRNSSDKTKSMANGGYVMVKTKLGRNKPTKIC